MAKSGVSTVAVTQYNNLKFTWVATQNPADNTSIIAWALYLTSTSYGAIQSTATKQASVVIDGVAYPFTTTIGINANSELLLGSGSTRVKHLSDGSKTFSFGYAVDFQITFAGKKIGLVENRGEAVLDAINTPAYVTKYPSFNDEENPTINYYCPANAAISSIEVCIADMDGYARTTYKTDINKTGTSYTFNLTDSDRERLRALVTVADMSTAVKYCIKTIYTDGSTKLSFSPLVPFSMINSYPALFPTVTETLTSFYTGNNSTIIKGYNSCNFTVGATAVKGATIVKQSVKCGSQQISGMATGTLANVDSGTFIFEVEDSRGAVVEKEIKLSFIDYFKPNCNLSINHTVADDTNITLNIEGKWFNGSFGVMSNSLSVFYRYKVNDGAYSSLKSVSGITRDGNSFSGSVIVSDISYKDKYTFQIRVIDSFNTVNSNEEIVKITPVFDWGENDFNFNVPVTIQGNPLTDYVIESGNDGSYAYRKWASGVAEAWRVAQSTVSLTANYAYGSMYYADNLSLSTTGGASCFVAVNSVQMTINKAGSMGLWMPVVKSWGVSSGKVTINYSVINPTNITATAIPCVYILGRWK